MSTGDRRAGLSHDGCSRSRTHRFSSGIEPKKGDDNDKYIPINTRMQRTQVSVHDPLIRDFCHLPSTDGREIIAFAQTETEEKLNHQQHLFLCPISRI